MPVFINTIKCTRVDLRVTLFFWSAVAERGTSADTALAGAERRGAVSTHAPTALRAVPKRCRRYALPAHSKKKTGCQRFHADSPPLLVGKVAGSVREDRPQAFVAGTVFGRGLVAHGGFLAAALAGAALRAAAARAGADHFAAAAVGAGDVHIHIAEGLLHALGVGVAAG